MPRKGAALLHHVSLEVTDIARAEYFHDRFLGRLGYQRFVKDPSYLGYDNGSGTIWLLRDRRPRIHRKPPVGDEEVISEHLAFKVSTAADVRAVESDLSKLELYPFFKAEEHPEFRPGYVSATWADPDGIVLEVYYPGPEARPKKARPQRRAPARRRAGKR